MAGAYGKLPGGDIKPNCFVKQGDTGYVLAAGAGDRVYGISGSGTRRIALEPYDDGLIGKLGDPAIIVHGPGTQPVLLRLGGSVTNGQYLKPDADSYGVAATTDKDHYGARALADGSAGELIPVEVIIGDLAV